MNDQVMQYAKNKLNETHFNELCQLETLHPTINIYSIVGMIIDAYYRGEMNGLQKMGKILQGSEIVKPNVEN